MKDSKPARIRCGMCMDTGLQNGVKCPQPGCAAAGSEREAFEKWVAESRRLNPDCGCQKRGSRQFRCSYHEGAEDAWEMAWQAARAAAPLNDADYWKSRATTAELKMLTFTEEIANLRAAAPAPPSREWIPVSGRLPEYSGDVIGCWWGGSVAIANLICGEWWYVSHSSGRIKANVAPDYWQPLPAPPVADSGASAGEEK